jgi:hypothetical protein
MLHKRTGRWVSKLEGHLSGLLCNIKVNIPGIREQILPFEFDIDSSWLCIDYP